MRKSVLLLFLLLVPITAYGQEPKLAARTTVSFADLEEAQKVLGARDDFVTAMSPFDRAARMKTDKPVSEEEFDRVYLHAQELGFEHLFVQFSNKGTSQLRALSPFLPDFERSDPFPATGQRQSGNRC